MEQRRGTHAVFSLLIAGFLLVVISAAAVCSGCAQNESKARQYISDGSQMASDLAISASSPTMGDEIDNLAREVVLGMAFDELKSRVASLDNDLTVVKDAFGKANTEYSKVPDLNGVPDWVKHANNLMRANDIVIQIDEKVLAMFHSYISSVEAGASPDFQKMVLQSASDISQMEAEYRNILKEAGDFSKQHGGE